MSESVRKSARKANSAGAQKWTPKSTIVRQILPFELFLRAIWPVDRTKNYMRLTGAKLHTAKHRVAGNRDPDYPEVVAVLRSDHGFEFLQHVMGDAKPKWWRSMQKARGLGDMRRAARRAATPDRAARNGDRLTGGRHEQTPSDPD